MSKIAFSNPYNDDSENTLIPYETEKEREAEERIVKKVLERLSLTVDITKAIQQIKELQELLKQFEKRFE